MPNFQKFLIQKQAFDFIPNFKTHFICYFHQTMEKLFSLETEQDVKNCCIVRFSWNSADGQLVTTLLDPIGSFDTKFSPAANTKVKSNCRKRKINSPISNQRRCIYMRRYKKCSPNWPHWALGAWAHGSSGRALIGIEDLSGINWRHQNVPMRDGTREHPGAEAK